MDIARQLANGFLQIHSPDQQSSILSLQENRKSSRQLPQYLLVFT
ncbi:hypothetical protein [Oceanobacillus oncorhynchi]|uniref:Uncharacterized protein n=1 Tax=Oceanobacillus aidingensis TaxID=645964 RepID=A0ABV9JVQ3_9BACI|nr:hypothetical protein [Oceanobacillus oncorhynchi]